MHAGKLVFAQVMEFAPWYTFRRLVTKYRGNFNVRTFSCLDQFLCNAFAQLTYRESLRDIQACLRAQPAKLYHLGLHGKVSRSALADANESRDWRIYGEFAQALIRIAQPLVCPRAARDRPGRNRLRARLHDDQSVLVAVPLGHFRKTEIR